MKLDRTYAFKRLVDRFNLFANNIENKMEYEPNEHHQRIYKYKAIAVRKVVEWIEEQIQDKEQYELNVLYFDLMDFIERELQESKRVKDITKEYTKHNGWEAGLVYCRVILRDEKIRLTDRW